MTRGTSRPGTAFRQESAAAGRDRCFDRSVRTAPTDGWPIWMDLGNTRNPILCYWYARMFTCGAWSAWSCRKRQGCVWEGKLIYNHLYLVDSPVQKFIPILFNGRNLADIRIPLRTMAYYSVDTGEGYQDLCRHLTNQPRHRTPALGQLKSLPPKEPQSYPASFAAPTAKKDFPRASINGTVSQC